MGRKSLHNLPPGIHQDKNGLFWATLEGADARLWHDRYPGRALPRRRAACQKEALQLQRKLIQDLERGRDPNASNPTVVEWVQHWIDGKHKLSPSTTKRYRQALRWQIVPHRIARLRLTQLMPEHIEVWIRALKAQPRRDDPTRTLDAYTIRNAFALLRAALNTAVARERISKNPCTAIELPRPDDAEVCPLTPQQVDTLLTAIDSAVLDRATGVRSQHRLAALYHLAIRCGLRQGELLGLRWADLDLERRELRVSGQLQGGVRVPTKTKHSNRTLPLSGDLVQVLDRHSRNQIEERAISETRWNEADLVFCSEVGTPINPANLTRQFDALLRRWMLPDIRFHDLRHTYAALSIVAGVDLYTLSRRMGHSSITVTADRYGHLYQGQTHDVDSLDRLLKRA